MNNTVLALLLLLLGIILISFSLNQRKKGSPKSEKAQVIKKYYGVDRSLENSGRSTAVRHRVAFKMEDGQQIELILSSEQYKNIEVGDSGTLSYVGRRFIDLK